MVDSQRLKLRATNKVLQKEIADRGQAEKALSESHKGFLNVLSNAVKFTPDGGRISVEAGIIEINKDQFPTADDNRHCDIKISVSDTGIGIEPKNLHRVFSPFEQVESSYSRKFQGTGLGLSLTKKLVELHGGKLWGESEGSGKGSTFHFIIPS